MELLKYIRNQERYLDRLEAALRVTQINSDEMDAFLRQIAAYSRAFEELPTKHPRIKQGPRKP